jgi:DNA-binding XRE family transcriptional regulator
MLTELSEAQQQIQQEWRQRGSDAVFVEAEGADKPAAFLGEQNVAVFTSEISDEDLQLFTSVHEFGHLLQAVSAGKAGEIEQELRQIDPQGFEKVEIYVDQTRPDLDEKGRADEIFSTYLESYGPMLLQADTIQRIQQTAPTLFERILNALIRMVNRIPGVRLEDTRTRALRELRDTLAQTEVAEGAAPEKLPDVVKTIQDALDFLRENTLETQVSPAVPISEPVTQPITTEEKVEPKEAKPRPGKVTPQQEKRARQKFAKIEKQERELVQRRAQEGVDVTKDVRVEELRQKKAKAKRPPRPEVTRRKEPTTAEAAIEAYEAGEDVRFSIGRRAPASDPLIRSGRTTAPVRTWLKEWLTSEGLLPSEAFDLKIEKEGLFAQHSKHAEFLLRDFERAVKDTYGKRVTQLTPEEIEKLDKGLRNPVERNKLPPRLRDALQAMRDHISTLQQMLIREGVVQGELAATIELSAETGVLGENEDLGLDFYLNRSYRALDRPDWAQKIPQDVWNRSAAWFRAEYPEWSEERIRATMQGILVDAQDKANPMRWLARLGKKKTDIFKQRKNIPEAIRELLGEYKDPRVNYIKTAAKISHLIASHRFMEQVTEKGMGRFFFSEEEKGRKKDGLDYVYPLTIDPIEALRLKGKEGEEGETEWSKDWSRGITVYTTEEIRDAFQEGLSNPEGWYQHWLKLNAIAKYSKTVLSVMTQMRNIMGNIGFATLSGHWNFLHGPTAIHTVLKEFGGKSSQEQRDFILKLTNMGVLGESVHYEELKGAIEDAINQGAEEWILSSPFKRTLALAAKSYRAGDDVWKIYGFLSERQRYMDLADMSEAEAEKKAAENVRNLYPTYSLVPLGVKKLRRFPLMGTFVSFPAEVFRVAKNAMILTQRELADKKLRKVGARRAVGLALASLGPHALATLFRHIQDIDREDDERSRVFMPPWSKNSEILWLGQDDEGNRTWVDFSYTDPFSYLTEAMWAFWRGESWEEKLEGSIAAVAEPFVSPELGTKAILEVWLNTKETGAPVYNPEASWEERYADMGKHVGKNLLPGTLINLDRIQKGVRGQQTRYGKKYDPKVEAAALFTGFRANSLNVSQALKFRAGEYKENIKNATIILTGRARRPGTVSDSEIRDAYQSMERARRRNFRRMYRATQAALALGVSEREVRSSLQAHLSRRSIRNLLTGRYEPYVPSSSFLRNELRSARPEERSDYKDRIRLIRNLYRAEMESQTRL